MRRSGLPPALLLTLGLLLAACGQPVATPNPTAAAGAPASPAGAPPAATATQAPAGPVPDAPAPVPMAGPTGQPTPPLAPASAAVPTLASSATGAGSQGAPDAATAGPSPAPAPATVAAPTATASVEAPAPAQVPAQTEATAPAAFSGVLARAHVDALAERIGSRPAGSDNDAAAVQYVNEQLTRAGYQPRVQSFPLRTYTDRGSQARVVSPRPRALDAATLQYAASGEVEAPLAAAGLGRPEDLAGQDLRGKVALVKRGSIPFGQKVANVARAGAAAALIFNSEPGNVQGTLGDPRNGPIPAVSVPREQGEALAQQLDAGELVVVRVVVDAAVEDRAGANVLASRPGSRPGAGTVVIGGHLDGVRAGPGANDNASGTAAMLELARVLAGRDTPFSLTFIAFGGEELGLFGSRAYVEQLTPEERQAIVAMLNLDMVGVGSAWRFGGTDQLVQAALGAARALVLPAEPLGGPLASASDHASFIAAGIPAVFLHRVNDPNYHTAEDRAQYVDPASLAEAGEIALRVLDGLASQVGS